MEQLDLKQGLNFQSYSRLLQAVVPGLRSSEIASKACVFEVKEDAETCAQILSDLCYDCEAEVEAIEESEASDSGASSSSEESLDGRDAMRPWFTVGRMQIWGRIHLFAILLSFVALILWMLASFKRASLHVSAQDPGSRAFPSCTWPFFPPFRSILRCVSTEFCTGNASGSPPSCCS